MQGWPFLNAQVLELLKPPQDRNQKSGLLPENVTKNRSEDIIPSNTHSLFLIAKFHENLACLICE